MIPDLPVPLTHPETARLVVAVPLLLTLAALLVAAIFGRSTLLPIYQTLLVRYASHHRIQHIDPALIYIPELVSVSQFQLICFLVVPALWLLLWFALPLWFALLFAPVLLVGVVWLTLRLAERRYINAINQTLAPTVGRMAALLANGGGFQPVLKRMVEDLPAGPLRSEWSFIVERLGVPLAAGGLATPQIVVNALRFQTPSHRHAILLEHLAVALGQTHDIVAKRMQAAAQALHDSDRRASAAVTELAQMRYSGVAVGLAGWFMVGYLALTQSERFKIAYQGPIGLIVGLIVGSALLAPLIGGVFLARADELDY